MADWQRTLNLLPEWRSAQDGEITPQLMAGVIASRLRQLESFGDPTGLDYGREEIAERFDEFSSDPGADAEDFDEIMADLYDWADTPLNGHGGKVFSCKKACWIKTF